MSFGTVHSVVELHVCVLGCLAWVLRGFFEVEITTNLCGFLITRTCELIFNNFCLGMGKESVKGLWVKISKQSNMGTFVVDLCYGPPE